MTGEKSISDLHYGLTLLFKYIKLRHFLSSFECVVRPIYLELIQNYK